MSFQPTFKQFILICEIAEDKLHDVSWNIENIVAHFAIES